MRPGAGDWSPDDLGAAEWGALIDGAAARLELGRADIEGDLVRQGYSPTLAARLAAEESDTGGHAGDCEASGLLRFTPDSGAGSGLRPSVLANLENAVESVRGAFAARVAAATTGAAATAARISAQRHVDIVQSLAEFAKSGRR